MDTTAIDRLRGAWYKAIDDDRPRDVVAALLGLEKAEPREAQWPHRLGDALRRAGRGKDAEAAFERAMHLYQKQGLLARAVAMAKLVATLNPARTDVFAGIDADATRTLRNQNRPSPEGPATAPKPPPVLVPPPPPRAPLAAPAAHGSPTPAAHAPHAPARAVPPSAAHAPTPPFPSRPPDEDERPSLIAGLPVASMRAVAAAPPLAPAHDVSKDEVRFADVSAKDAVEIDVSDLAPDDANAHARAEDAPNAGRLALMTAATLFAEVSRDALGGLSRAASLMELDDAAPIFAKDSACDALYVIAVGTVRVLLPHLADGGVDLTEGQVFGEGCLLDGARRQADVRAKGKVTLLRIAKEALDAVVAKHVDVGNVLFDLLVQRLIANTLHSSPLFAAFDPATRRELARLFEVRRAAPRTTVMERGKRSDGLYVALAGHLQSEDAGGPRRLELGTAFGQEALLARAASTATVRTVGEAVLLRLPAASFGTFALSYPPALAHLAELRDAG